MTVLKLMPLAVLILLLIKPSHSQSVGHDQSPNVIFFLADDLGYGDLGISGHPTSSTPHIDYLGLTGRVFTHYYVTSPICSPSRASLLTGRYQVRSGVYPGTFVPDSVLGLPNQEITIADLMKKKGYATQIVGKWHLGVGRNGEFLPTNFGFDKFLGLPYSHDMCPCLTCFPNNQSCYDQCWTDRVSCPLYKNDVIIEQPTYLPDLTSKLVDEALNFITESQSNNKTFFLYFPFLHIHHPQFASKKFHGLSNRGTTGDSLLELDWAVGEILHLLKSAGLYENTLIWLTSDNGPSMLRQERGGCAGLLRCGKGTTMEGGVRVPSIVHWADKIKPGKSDGLVSALDVLPTLSKILDLSLDPLPIIDGVDISPLLWDFRAQSPRSSMAVYPESPNQETGPYAVVNGRYKAHFYTKGSSLSDDSNFDGICRSSHYLTKHEPPLLFDLYVDPGERYNLAHLEEYRDVVNNITIWRQSHMESMTWMEPRTQVEDRSAQPCCSSQEPTISRGSRMINGREKQIFGLRSLKRSADETFYDKYLERSDDILSRSGFHPPLSRVRRFAVHLEDSLKDETLPCQPFPSCCDCP